MAPAKVSTFIDGVNSCGLSHKDREPTRINSVLDLVFTLNVDDTRLIHILNKISDHNLVLGEMTRPIVSRKITPNITNVYNEVNETSLNQSLEWFASEYELNFNERTVEST